MAEHVSEPLKSSRLYLPADALFWLAAIIEKMGEVVHGWATRRIAAQEDARR